MTAVLVIVVVVGNAMALSKANPVHVLHLLVRQSSVRRSCDSGHEVGPPFIYHALVVFVFNLTISISERVCIFSLL